ncbi:MAG: DUF4254 domain-containing protein, partial [Rikenellaceae bacterium]
MKFSELCNELFDKAIVKYHITDDVDAKVANPYEKAGLEHLLFAKNWIDIVQWHLEDIIRDPNIDPIEALKIKRRIDASNQDRTDMVEYIDSYFLEKYKDIKILQSTVIKVAHHGSKSSSIEDFIETVKPKIAIIGVGE